MFRKTVPLFFVICCFLSTFAIYDAISATHGAAIGTVKNRALSADKSITIGSALEGNVFLKNAQWYQYIDAQQIQLVDFIADVDLSRIPGFDEQAKEQLSKVLVRLTVQFEVNKDASLQIRVVGFSTPYGIIYASDSEQNGREIMNILYKNEIPDFRPALRNMLAAQVKSLSALKEEVTEKPQILTYSLESKKLFAFADTFRYSDKVFNIEIRGGQEGTLELCEYKNICTRNGENFICKGKNGSNEVSGKITSAGLEIGVIHDSVQCTAPISFVGKYTKFSLEETPKLTVHKKRVKPLQYDDAEDLAGYSLEEESGEMITVLDQNNVRILDKFVNTWIDVEYLSYSAYFESAGENTTFYVLYKVNGKNPMDIQ